MIIIIIIILDLAGTSVLQKSIDRANALKIFFSDVIKHQLKIYGDQPFLRSDLIEIFVTSNFDELFDVDDDIRVSFESLPTYSIENVDSLDNYFREWVLRYNELRLTKGKVEERMLKMLYKLREPFLSLLVVFSIEYERTNGRSPTHKLLRGLIGEKMRLVLGIGERQERKYWNGTWQLIELLHLTRCPASILVKARVTSKYLMASTSDDYNGFLRNLLNDEKVFSEFLVFDELSMQKVKEIICRREVNT